MTAHTSPEPALHRIGCDGAGVPHRMAWWQWGQPDAAHAVLCLHGLSRQGRDFDALAQALLARACSQNRPLRVICPDVAGRGQSEWLGDARHYTPATYLADMCALLRHLRQVAPIARLDWVGTSMGGIVGMLMAALPAERQCVPLSRLVINDVGPRVEWAGWQRICQHLLPDRLFGTFEEGLAELRRGAETFGAHTDAQWHALLRPMLQPAVRADGGQGWRLHYDPAIAHASRAVTQQALAQGEAAMWAYYDRIACPTLVLRGALSDVFSEQTAQDMAQRGPAARLVTFDGVGHAPTLIQPEQQAAVLDFLLPAAEPDGMGQGA